MIGSWDAGTAQIAATNPTRHSSRSSRGRQAGRAARATANAPAMIANRSVTICTGSSSGSSLYTPMKTEPQSATQMIRPRPARVELVMRADYHEQPTDRLIVWLDDLLDAGARTPRERRLDHPGPARPAERPHRRHVPRP